MNVTVSTVASLYNAKRGADAGIDFGDKENWYNAKCRIVLETYKYYAIVPASDNEAYDLASTIFTGLEASECASFNVVESSAKELDLPHNPKWRDGAFVFMI